MRAVELTQSLSEGRQLNAHIACLSTCSHPRSLPPVGHVGLH